MTDPTSPCCKQWIKIRPLLGWFQIDGSDMLVMTVLGRPVSGATRVLHCPRCGAPVRDAKWLRQALAELEGQS